MKTLHTAECPNDGGELRYKEGSHYQKDGVNYFIHVCRACGDEYGLQEIYPSVKEINDAEIDKR